jgi:uncharacterized Rmd1/YagE family protein
MRASASLLGASIALRLRCCQPWRDDARITVARQHSPTAGHLPPQTEQPAAESGAAITLPHRFSPLFPASDVQLVDASPERLLLVATVLARSAVLARDETLVFEAFDRIGPLVADLRENGRTYLSIRQAMHLVGDVLSARHRIMGTVQADERPDLLWDHPHLDRLYTRLEAEYELDERAEVLERKFVEPGDFTEVLLDIVRDKRAYRLELALIGLIAFEIVLSLFTIIAR